MSKDKENLKSLKLSEKIVEFFKQYFFGLLGVYLVYSISNYGNINPVIVTSGITLSGTIIFPKQYQFVFFSAGLAGIMTKGTLDNIIFLLLTGTFVTIISKLTEGIFKDIGGKPGTIAFISNSITLLIVYLIGLSGVYTYDVMSVVYKKEYYENLNYWVYIFAPFFTSLAAFSVHLFSEAKGIHVLRLTIYGVVCLTGCFLLNMFTVPYFKFENGSIMYYGTFYITYWHVGCLTGLSIKEKYKHFIINLYFYHYILAGYIAGWLYITISPVILVGGKHGLIAFIANNVYVLIVHMIFKLLKMKETPADIMQAEIIHHEEKKKKQLENAEMIGIEERRPISLQFT